MNITLNTIQDTPLSIKRNFMELRFPRGIHESDVLSILDDSASTLLMSDLRVELMIIPGDMPITPATILAIKDYIRKYRGRINTAAFVCTDDFRRTVFRSLLPPEYRCVLFCDSLQEAHRFLKLEA